MMLQFAVGAATRAADPCLGVLWDALSSTGFARHPDGPLTLRVLLWDDAVWVLGDDAALLQGTLQWAVALGQVLRVHSITATADEAGMVVRTRLALVHADGTQTLIAHDDDADADVPAPGELAARLLVALEFHESLHDDADAQLVRLAR